MAALESLISHLAKSQEPKSIRMGTSSSDRRMLAGFRSRWAIADGKAVSKSITAESLGFADAAAAAFLEEEEAGAGGGEWRCAMARQTPRKSLKTRPSSMKEDLERR